jgi:dihydrofolate synthase / folylpolyglutamate synthase
MDYYQWILSKLPPHKIRKNRKTDLLRIQSFCNYLGNPEHSFKSIHIGGTNGKGSVAHMLSSILQESGLKTGLLTSPHLKNLRERIRYNGLLIEEDFIVSYIRKHKIFAEKIGLSFFELMTSLAFLYFKEKNVDIAVIEVGMGGRMDSTNIITPIISIITNISYDHTDFLGKNLSQIAYEKAGIIKPKIPVVLGSFNDETNKVFREIAFSKKSPIFYSDNSNNSYAIPLKGNYQILNKKTVIKSIDVLQSLGFKITENSIILGFKNVIKNTKLQGRWQVIRQKPKIICDTAHNEEGIKWVTKQLMREYYNKLYLILGFVRGKDVLKILSHFPSKAYYYFCQPNLHRRFHIEDLEKLVRDHYKKNAKYFLTVKEALHEAEKSASKEDFIFVGGSNFVVAEII